MSDKPDPTVTAHRDDGLYSTSAVISYLIVAVFTLSFGGVLTIIGFRIPVEPTMLTVLGGVLATSATALQGVVGYWLSSSSGAKANSAAIRQLAGAGPPPPADPSTTTTEKK